MIPNQHDRGRHVVYRLAMASVVIVEDDNHIRDLAVRALAGSGHVVWAEGTGMAGLQSVIDNNPDVLVLDLGLPDVDGSDVLRMVRGVSQVPVIIATARDDDAEIVRLLDAGADEYVVKPFSGAELEARVRALLRRISAAGPDHSLQVGDLAIDLRARTAVLDGRSVVLNRKEFDLLAFLATRANEVVTRQELYAEVWRQPYGGADKTIDVHVSWLRRKLGETAAEPRYLHTVRGVGIKLVDPR
jgi:DNA-binding response OmpR family regulator